MTRLLTLTLTLLFGVLFLSGRTARPMDAWAYDPESVA